MFRHTREVVPQDLLGEIAAALGRVDEARAELAEVISTGAPMQERRAAYTRVRLAYDEADLLLRRATALARERSYRDWSLWRRRLSRLDAARQAHLFAEQDDTGMRRIGSVRALDTGMAGPSIGEMQHGESREPGAVATYGLDIDAVLVETDRASRAGRTDATGLRTAARTQAATFQPAIRPGRVAAW